MVRVLVRGLKGVKIKEEEKKNAVKKDEDQEVNILFLGETGVGKSTLINAIGNYFKFKDFESAIREQVTVIIPTAISVTNEAGEIVSLQIGSDENEVQNFGDAVTQKVKTYLFPIGKTKRKLCLIDSPGLGDPRGVEQDNKNCENILAYLSQLSELHGICFLMKPTHTRNTAFFEYCVKQILCRLEKSAGEIIIFIFTNTRGTNYSPGDTLGCLQRLIDDIRDRPPFVNIPFGPKNMFSLDNEAFKILVGLQKNIKFDQRAIECCKDSWLVSLRECERLIGYVIGHGSQEPLKPHQMQNTVSINEAKRLIDYLSQPLADILKLIDDNIRLLDRHKLNLKIEDQSIDVLKKQMYIPYIGLRLGQLDQPATVCTAKSCTELVKVGDVNSMHFRQRCHDPCSCNIGNSVKVIIGDSSLKNCTVINAAGTCTKCKCSYSVHMRTHYTLDLVNDKTVDKIMEQNIITKEKAHQETERLTTEIDQRKKELEDELDIIINSTAKFAHFLQLNGLSPFSDSYRDYLEYQIARESGLGDNSDKKIVDNLQNLLKRYDDCKADFDRRAGASASPSVTAADIKNTVKELYRLKHFGPIIEELFEKQSTSRKSEYNKNCEHVNSIAINLKQPENKEIKTIKKEEEFKGKKHSKNNIKKKDEKSLNVDKKAKKDSTKEKASDNKSSPKKDSQPPQNRHPTPPSNYPSTVPLEYPNGRPLGPQDHYSSVSNENYGPQPHQFYGPPHFPYNDPQHQYYGQAQDSYNDPHQRQFDYNSPYQHQKPPQHQDYYEPPHNQHDRQPQNINHQTFEDYILGTRIYQNRHDRWQNQNYEFSSVSNRRLNRSYSVRQNYGLPPNQYPQPPLNQDNDPRRNVNYEPHPGEQHLINQEPPYGSLSYQNCRLPQSHARVQPLAPSAQYQTYDPRRDHTHGLNPAGNSGPVHQGRQHYDSPDYQNYGPPRNQYPQPPRNWHN